MDPSVLSANAQAIDMSNSNTVNENSSVTWIVDFSTVRDQLVLVYLFFLAVAFVALLFTVRHVWSKLQRSRSHFWRASLLGVALLLPTPLGEYGFTLSMWSNGTLWTFPPLLTLLVTVFVRIGYGFVTICRLYRLYLISPTRPVDAKRHFRLMSLVVTFVITINLSSSAALRIIETQHNQSGALAASEESTDTVRFYREQHKYFGFVTFMVVHVTNLVCDYLFAKRVMESARSAAAEGAGGVAKLRSRDVVRLVLPYIPPAATTVMYVVVTMMTLVDGEQWRSAVYFSIGLNRLAPLVEASCFYLWSVGHTRVLLKALSLSHTKSNTAATGQPSEQVTSSAAIPLDSHYAKSVYTPSPASAEQLGGPPPPAYMMMDTSSGTVSLGTVTASTATADSECLFSQAPLSVPRVYVTPPPRTRQVPRSPQPQVRMHF